MKTIVPSSSNNNNPSSSSSSSSSSILKSFVKLLVRFTQLPIYVHATLLTVLLVSLSFSIYLHDLMYASSLNKPLYTSPLLNASDPVMYYYLQVDVYIKSINANAGNCVLEFRFTPSPTLFQPKSNEKKLIMNMTVVSRNYQRTFGSELWRVDQEQVTLPFTSTSIRGYPFDTHIGILDISAYLNAKEATETRMLLPLQLNLTQTVPGYKFAQRPTALLAGLFYIQLEFMLIRSYLIMGYSVFMAGVCWVLSGLMGYLALQIVVNKRDIPTGLLMPPLLLLFALPSLRNAQPQRPPVGSTFDILAFFWNMTIVAISAMAITSCYIFRWKNPNTSR
ncbi:hypothetical protein HMI55_004977 [Coelomomyces lativittatus]|nr:hypothetical protein HMI56_003384 [Coelomomyces lativittatus]KAJ1514078.1 hypothetical protein HMI55_004977 [Coelomomyces lativittatus]